MSIYKIYADRDYVDSKSLPEGATANQQLVTDADGVAKWEEKLAYTASSEIIKTYDTLSWNDNNVALLCESDLYLTEGTLYTVTYNGKEYTAPASYNSDYDMFIITLSGSLDDGSELIEIGQTGDKCELAHLNPSDDLGDEVTIRYTEKTVKTIDPMYLPKGNDLCVATFSVQVATSMVGSPDIVSLTCDKTDEELLAAYENGTLIAYVTDNDIVGFKTTATIRKDDGGSDWYSWYFALEYSFFRFNYWYHRCIFKAIDCPENEFMGSDYCRQIVFSSDIANNKLRIIMGNQDVSISN